MNTKILHSGTKTPFTRDRTRVVPTSSSVRLWSYLLLPLLLLYTDPVLCERGLNRRDGYPTGWFARYRSWFALRTQNAGFSVAVLVTAVKSKLMELMGICKFVKHHLASILPT